MEQAEEEEIQGMEFSQIESENNNSNSRHTRNVSSRSRNLLLAHKYRVDEVYPKMLYKDLKKILIRLKDRNFLCSYCSICLDPIDDMTMCRMLSCYHIFHVDCIDDWFKTDPQL